MYVLLSKEEMYFVEYLLGQHVANKSISEAMVFEEAETALKFKQMLYDHFKVEYSVNTFINQKKR